MAFDGVDLKRFDQLTGYNNKMKRIWSIVLCMLSLCSAVIFAEDFKRIDYYVWDRHDTKGINIDGIQSLDVLIYFGFIPDGNGTVTMDAASIAHLADLKAVMNPATDLWIGTKSDGMLGLIGNPTKIQEFIDSIQSLSATHGFVGLDLDWERNDHAVADYVSVVSDISDGLRSPSFELCTSVGNYGHYIDKTVGVKDKVDWINIQYYYSDLNAWSVAQIASNLQTFHARGVPAEKLAIGLPLYGSNIGESSSLGYNTMIAEGASPTANIWTRPSNGITYYYSGVPLITDKTQYAIDNGYRGVFTWELTLDVDYSSNDSILRAIDLVLLAGPTRSYTNLLVDIQMGDAAGTGLNAVLNEGSDGGAWNANYSGGSATDGAGLYIVTNIVVDNYRRYSFTPVTTGDYVLEYRFDSWDFSGAADNALFNWGVLGATSGYDLFEIRKSGSVARLANAVDLPIMSAGTGVVVQLTWDLDTGIRIAKWKWDTDAEFTTFNTGGTTLVGGIKQLYSEVYGAGPQWGAGDFLAIDYMTFKEIVENPSPSALYGWWLAGYPGLGASTNLTDNPDGDALNNLGEYAFGGNPNDGGDTGNAITDSSAQAGGTNYLEYVYPKRTDAVARGLDYGLAQTTNLVSGLWTNANYEVTGTGVIDLEFNAVTNRISTDAEAQQFLKLKVESSF